MPVTELAILKLRGGHDQLEFLARLMHAFNSEMVAYLRKELGCKQLVNAGNIVRRCSRLIVASILRGYHAFHTRGKSGLWQFDEKKASQGFNKAKRKYIKK